MRKSSVLFVLLLMIGAGPLTAQLRSDSIFVEGRYRSFSYRKHVGIKPAASLMFLMHGSGGTGAKMVDGTSKLEAVALRENLVIVYPDAWQNYWNECRLYSTARANRDNINEEAFFRGMINFFDSAYGIDKHKVFAAGMSGGGHMAYKLGLTMPGEIHAIAAIIANLPDSASSDCAPVNKALPVLIINGTLDNTNPYNGGEMFVNNASFGVVRSTESTFQYWARLAGYRGQPSKQMLPDADPGDKKRIEAYTYKSKGKPEISLLKVIGGQHNYPNDIDVFLYIWDFFKRSLE